MTRFKKFLMLFALLGMSVGAGAMTHTINLDPFTLDPTQAAGVLSGGYNISNVTGAFDIDIDFEVVNAPVGGVSGAANVISVQIFDFFGVDDTPATPFIATLDGTPMTINFIPLSADFGTIFGDVLANLTNGLHTINLFGNALAGGATLSGNVAINPSAVPIPAAVWLFGSGLLGVFGVNRRFKGNA